jgi:uncharacterized protein
MFCVILASASHSSSFLRRRTRARLSAKSFHLRVRAGMPQTWFEMIAWVLLSLTGGFCEEVIFRGYLQRQFSAFTHSLVGRNCVSVHCLRPRPRISGLETDVAAIYGLCLGLLAHWRHSLRPDMIGHAVQDTAGLLAFLTR